MVRVGSRGALRFITAAALLAGLPLGCGKSSHSEPRDAAGTSGSSGGGAGRSSGAGGGGAPAAGSSGAVSGRGGQGGGGDDGGGTTGEGGDAPNDAGASASGSAGTPERGGNAGAGGSAGDAESAGASGQGGLAGSGGAPLTCVGCEPLEACFTDGSGSRCVAALVPLPTGLAIDATEVTRGQYTAWLATEPAPAAQAEACAWNPSFAPDARCIAAPSVCQGDDDCARHPQPCIDFCDATAYCSALGRRLCSQAEWTSSCSADRAYPLGREEGLDAGTCNDFSIYGTTTRPVASDPGCQPPASSGFGGVYDMIGNVEEWTDACFGEDTCRTFGQSFGMGAAAPMCSQATYAKRTMFRDNLGFRCCSPQAG